LNEAVISSLLGAEDAYHAAVKKAMTDAENYANESKKAQRAYLEALKQEWELFEKTELKNLKIRLAEAEQKAEEETARIKERLKAEQEKKADMISDRLKEEVLSLPGSN
jgi:F0F1-type ATP synthase membrane subunit b/b'